MNCDSSEDLFHLTQMRWNNSLLPVQSLLRRLRCTAFFFPTRRSKDRPTLFDIGWRNSHSHGSPARSQALDASITLSTPVQSIAYVGPLPLLRQSYFGFCNDVFGFGWIDQVCRAQLIGQVELHRRQQVHPRLSEQRPKCLAAMGVDNPTPPQGRR